MPLAACAFSGTLRGWKLVPLKWRSLVPPTAYPAPRWADVQSKKRLKSLNTLEFIGASLTIVGSFLLWERAGDFLSYDLIEVRVDFANFKYWMTGIHEFPVYDNGGVLVILLTSAIILLALRPPGFIRNPSLWKLIISVLLMGLSLF